MPTSGKWKKPIVSGWVLAWVVAVGALGTPGDIYQWTYDQLALGPGWRGHVFANRTGKEVVGLELLLAEVGPAQVLTVGGTLALTSGNSGVLPFSGRVIPGGVVTVALPDGAALHAAAWVTSGGLVPIEIEAPIPRLDATEIWPSVVIVAIYPDLNDLEWHVHWRDPGSGLPLRPRNPVLDDDPEPSQPNGPTVEFILLWPTDLDVELLRGWEGYPYLVHLDGRRSFSPVGEEIVAWRWTWEDGLVQEGPVAARGFDRPGIYWVRLTVTDSSGRIQTLTRFVEAADGEAALAVWLDQAAAEATELMGILHTPAADHTR